MLQARADERGTTLIILTDAHSLFRDGMQSTETLQVV